MFLLSPLARLVGLGRQSAPSFFATPPALQTARETIAALPDVVKAVLVLPTLAEQLADVQRNTVVLPQVRDELVIVRNTVIGMRADTDKIVEEMPKLVVLERSLPAMLPILEDMDRSVERLADIAEPLQGAALRLGRISDRLPHRNGN